MEDIVEKAKAGDKAAFISIFDPEFRKEMYALAEFKLSNAEDAKDAIQDTILEAYKSIKSVKDNSKVKHWIMKVLVSKCNNIFRRNKKYEELTNEKTEDLYANDCIEDVNTRVDLGAMMYFLDSKSRDIMFLVYIGYTSKKISEILDMRESTVRCKIKRAKEKLRRKYGEVGYNEKE